jgi:hypothetical protein
MKKLTFEQAMRLTLGNLNITKVIDEELPTELWSGAYLADKKNVDKFLDAFCEDMAFLSNRPISRQSYLDATFNLFGRLRIPYDTLQKVVKDYYAKTIKGIDRYINEVIDNLQCKKTYDISSKPFPFSKIRRFDKKIISAYFSTANEEVKQVLLKDPTRKNIDEVQKPKHIVELLDKLGQTHYDYQPYILDDGDEKLLVISLGNDWSDIAIASWKPASIMKIDNLLKFFSFLFLFFGACGLWFNGLLLSGSILEIAITIFSIVSCVLSLVLAGLLFVRNNKSFKV